MPIAATGSDTAVRSTLNALLVKQRAAQLRDGAPSAAIRIDRLNRCIGLLVDHRSEIETALNADFGARSAHVSAFADVASSIGPLKHARQHVARWMKAGEAQAPRRPARPVRRQGRSSATSPRASSASSAPGISRST